jgi:hypothetical protein
MNNSGSLNNEIMFGLLSNLSPLIFLFLLDCGMLSEGYQGLKSLLEKCFELNM